MADGCLQKLVKYTLFFTNFLVFILGLVTLGFGIWVVVDDSSLKDLFDKATDVLDTNGVDTSGWDIGLYSSAPYILIAVAVIVSLISFFGCCGAIKENKCMLITYFVILIAIFIAGIVGAVLTFQGKLDEKIKDPLKKSMEYYKEDSTDPQDEAFNNIWNEVQKELKCCGIDNAKDWMIENPDNFGQPNGYRVPEGCCEVQRNIDSPSDADIQTCRKAGTDPEGNKNDSYKNYYFEGCYTVILNEIEEQQDKIYAAAITCVVVMFINMLSAFAMCTMAD